MVFFGSKNSVFLITIQCFFCLIQQSNRELFKCPKFTANLYPGPHQTNHGCHNYYCFQDIL